MPASAAKNSKLDAPEKARTMTAGEKFCKRAIDVVGAAAGLIVSAPAIGQLALLVKLQDGGPAIHRRRVVGPAGEFDAFKLRTMRVDADDILSRDTALREEFQVNFKLKDDPRVTRVGRFLRRLSLDELPQLWNVLRGEMSLVGPRMISPGEREKYGDTAWIFSVRKPGLTGYWQAYGNANGTYEERVAMDLEYVNGWSLLWDLKILLMTPVRVLRGKGTE